jgi:hypothetical protein
MFFIEFSTVRIGAIGMLHPAQSFNRDFFVNAVLSSMIDDSTLSRPTLKARGMFLNLDNARPHLCNDTFKELWIGRRPHLPSSEDLAPCNFSLFRHHKQCLKGQSFDNPVALQIGGSEILMSIEVGTFVRVFTEWKRCLRQYIEEGGDSLEASRVALLFLKLSRSLLEAKGLTAPSAHGIVRGT